MIELRDIVGLRVGTIPEEESRAVLQERVTALFRLMFWSFAVLVAFLAALYTAYPTNAPRNAKWVYVMASVALGAMAFIWRVLLLRRALSVRALYRLDLVYSLGIGCAFGAAAYLQHDLRASGYLGLVYATYTVFARALIMPSSGWRTAKASIATALPMFTAGSMLAFTVKQDLPGWGYFVGMLLFCTVLLVIATAGSHIIYGLRKQVSAAQQLGSYTLDRKIGEGGNGEVHLAHHILLRRPTAVKIMHPERVGVGTLERFEREVQAMSRLTHPNTVAVYDYGRSADGVFYYAMEYLGGGIDLDKLVRKHGAQPSGRVAHILAQVCGALHEAHISNFIHRDIKPANIILCERGGMPDVAKVVDYGLVKEIDADTNASTQVVLGTPNYIAPEAFTNPNAVGPGIDIYALGAVGYFLLTGRHVFDGKSPVDICIAHVTKPVTPPSEIAKRYVAPELEAIILKCLAKQPVDRFATVDELRDRLLALPPAKDWNEDDARHWWRDFRAVEESVKAASQVPTVTITVDLERRERLSDTAA